MLLFLRFDGRTGSWVGPGRRVWSRLVVSGPTRVGSGLRSGRCGGLCRCAVLLGPGPRSHCVCRPVRVRPLPVSLNRYIPGIYLYRYLTVPWYCIRYTVHILYTHELQQSATTKLITSAPILSLHLRPRDRLSGGIHPRHHQMAPPSLSTK